MALGHTHSGRAGVDYVFLGYWKYGWLNVHAHLDDASASVMIFYALRKIIAHGCMHVEP